MDFTDVALTALQVVSPVLVAALTWAAAKLATFIRSKVDNEYLRGVLVRLDDAVVTAVKDLWLCGAPHNQSYAEPIVMRS
jgi:hypothetical protein